MGIEQLFHALPQAATRSKARRLKVSEFIFMMTVYFLFCFLNICKDKSLQKRMHSLLTETRGQSHGPPARQFNSAA